MIKALNAGEALFRVFPRPPTRRAAGRTPTPPAAGRPREAHRRGRSSCERPGRLGRSVTHRRVACRAPAATRRRRRGRPDQDARSSSFLRSAVSQIYEKLRPPLFRKSLSRRANLVRSERRATRSLRSSPTPGAPAATTSSVTATGCERTTASYGGRVCRPCQPTRGWLVTATPPPGDARPCGDVGGRAGGPQGRVVRELPRRDRCGPAGGTAVG